MQVPEAGQLIRTFVFLLPIPLDARHSGRRVRPAGLSFAASGTPRGRPREREAERDRERREREGENRREKERRLEVVGRPLPQTEVERFSDTLRWFVLGQAIVAPMATLPRSGADGPLHSLYG